jgi:enoyl-CoA hydratase/carnithine racemase
VSKVTAPSDRPSDRAAMQALIEAGGLGLSVVTLAGEQASAPHGEAGRLVLGVHRGGPRPTGGLDAFDMLLSVDADAPAPWVSIPTEGMEAEVRALAEVVERQPLAAAVAAQVLRVSLKLALDEALVQESLGYSMLLASAPFRAWRTKTPPRAKADTEDRVDLFRRDGALHIRLNRPQARNAVDARMRDALVEALEFAVLDPEGQPVVLSGAGPSFCAGGDLDEFGRARDPAAAHSTRVLQSAARLVAGLGDRITARLHGACVGAGIEVPAAAGRVLARPGTLFRLPEVGMGLIPGAGGTATIPRRIGRQRACYMAVSGRDIDLATALEWGLVDAVDASKPSGLDP